jgi:hypothetical protein
MSKKCIVHIASLFSEVTAKSCRVPYFLFKLTPLFIKTNLPVSDLIRKQKSFSWKIGPSDNITRIIKKSLVKISVAFIFFVAHRLLAFTLKLRVRLTICRIKQTDKSSIIGERFYNLFVLLIPALSILILR